MRKALSALSRFRNDEDGAALIEYTVLLGILLVAVVATIGVVGAWVGGQWTTLSRAVNQAPLELHAETRDRAGRPGEGFGAVRRSAADAFGRRAKAKDKRPHAPSCVNEKSVGRSIA